MSRRMLVRAISFIAFAVITSFVMNIENARRINRYEEVISDNYYYAFSEIVSGMTKIDYALKKCTCSADDAMIATLAGEVLSQSEGTTRALARLPISELALENTTEFISKTGDFAYYLAKKAAHGGKITEAERESVAHLADGAGDIVRELHRISNRLERDGIDIADIDYSVQNDRTLNDIKNLEREFSEYPTLIYDGPFSDETGGSGEYIKSLPSLSDSELLSRVERFAEETGFYKEGERVENGIPIESFSNQKTYIDITRNGGLVLRSISDNSPAGRELSIEEGLGAARGFMKKNGFSEFSETYYMCYGENLTVNYAAKSGETVIYPELVKVTISLFDGEVVSFDSSGYVKNHRKRNLRDISGERDVAQSRVSGKLKVLSWSPAIIPTDGVGEVLCHEFKCETENGEHCIVYINADTLFEERVLILIEDENGTLVM